MTAAQQEQQRRSFAYGKGGDLSAGKFGFYNYPPSGVRYGAVAQDGIVPNVPEPAARDALFPLRRHGDKAAAPRSRRFRWRARRPDRPLDADCRIFLHFCVNHESRNSGGSGRNPASEGEIGVGNFYN